MGDLTAHFSRREFACHHCGVIKIEPRLAVAAERLRVIVGKPCRVVSGYRCTVHNRAVGGARASRHLRGEAMDVERGYCTVEQARQAGFHGIGVDERGRVVHVDVRGGPTIVFTDT